MKSIWVICGGKSSEHDISLVSAQNVVVGLQQEAFAVSVVYIDRNGCWYYLSAGDFLHWRNSTLVDGIPPTAKSLAVFPGVASPFYLVGQPQSPLHCDCVFSVVHGGQGEDGDLQGMLNCLCVPFVGSDVLGSSVCMAKHVAKALLDSVGIPTVPGAVVTKESRYGISFKSLCDQFACTELFVKPSACGSSIGVSRVRCSDDFDRALTEALCYDATVLIEKAIVAREIECSVMGNQVVHTALPGEVVMQDAFYDYAAKYVNNTAEVVTPARLQPRQVTAIRSLAQRVFTTLNCCGLARVDFFLTADNQLFVNEVNTLPGFTDISMFAKNWVASGLTFGALLKDLINFAVEYYVEKKARHDFLLRPGAMEKVSADER